MPYYRSQRTGRIGEFSAAAASHFPDLVEVGKDAKPLAYTPIPEAAIEALRNETVADTDVDPKKGKK